MIAAFSAGAGDVASKLEQVAACGDLEECRPLVERLVTIAATLVESVSGLSVERCEVRPTFAAMERSTVRSDKLLDRLADSRPCLSSSAHHFSVGPTRISA